MELDLSPDQKLFQETSQRFLHDTSPLTAVRALEDDERGFDPEWWRQSAELGWTSMLAPEALGGGSLSGDGVRDLALVAYERGRLVAPGPFVPTNVVIGALADAADDHADLIGDLMAGAAVAALAIEEPGRPANDPATTAGTDGATRVLTGTKVPVEAGAHADVLLVSARSDSGEPLLVVVPADAAGVTITGRQTVDLVRRFAHIELAGVEFADSAVVGRGVAALDRVYDIANALQLAETVGALDRVFEFTLEWAFDRHTFGRPLASYQELKHRFADMKLWLEASKATVVDAVGAVAVGAPDASELVSAAKSYVSEHGPELVQDCVQLHGGIGVTWDHDIHLYLRRVTLNSATYGTARDHRERLAAMILEEV